MSEAADAILEAGIRDAKTALLAISGFDAQWKLFVAACQAHQFDLAAIHGERLVALVESSVDLFAASNRRIAQFDKLTQGPDE